MLRLALLAVLGLALTAACADGVGDGISERSPTAAPTATMQAEGADDAEPAGDGLFPDVVAAEASQRGDGTWTFNTTLSSPYDSAERYADAWRVLAPDGSVLGVRELLHDHANEQPFTRSLTGIEVPDDVTEVTIEGRDQVNGWGGATVTIALER